MFRSNPIKFIEDKENDYNWFISSKINYLDIFIIEGNQYFLIY